LTDLIFMFRLR